MSVPRAQVEYVWKTWSPVAQEAAEAGHLRGGAVLQQAGLVPVAVHELGLAGVHGRANAVSRDRRWARSPSEISSIDAVHPARASGGGTV
jgi:hypothetical protein